MTLSDFIIDSSGTLRQALQRMTHNRRGVLFVCDEGAHLIGVLSDGDVRRSLLEDTLLVSPVAKVMNTDPVTANSLAEATELLQRLAIVAVPVVDAGGRITEAAVEDENRVLALTLGPAENQGGANIAVAALAVIPARGGSKRIPKKNLAMVAGRSLLGWTIRAAREAASVSHILVSTDDPAIAEESRKLGVEVPWLRPAHLSRDDSPTLEALEHALQWAVDNIQPIPQFGVLLEPTAPLRRGEHIDRALRLLVDSDTDCVMSVSEVPHLFNPEELLTIAEGEVRPYLPYRTMSSRKLRGEQSSVYVPNGLVYAFRIAPVLGSHSLFGEKTTPLVTPWDEFLDVDTEDDLQFAELRIERQRR
jgi:CMP-N,N'-diacetyllegionaminic acid synthase